MTGTRAKRVSLAPANAGVQLLPFKFAKRYWRGTHYSIEAEFTTPKTLLVVSQVCVRVGGKITFTAMRQPVYNVEAGNTMWLATFEELPLP